MNKRYSELIRFETFDERLAYLKIGGAVGRATFGFDRLINQRFYKSREWQDVRRFVLLRDQGCDLGVPGYDIYEAPHVHHMNPISLENIVQHEECIFEPEMLITTSQRTHNAIHYGSDVNLYPKIVTRRMPGDTTPWKE